ncbi:MAG TPA: rhamnulokinase family protein [Solirubrobacteraceae bacterium]|nr:rhamnulokinase family protein [Solirubrobacteraceae bacterium]
MPACARAFAAVDLGAESGRVMVGRVGDRSLALESVHRFANLPVRLHDGLHWDMPRLLTEILQGIARGARSAGRLEGIGIDAWGVDYALLDEAGRMLGLPYHYRDERVTGDVLARVHARVPRDELYARTGIQTMPINTVFQLMAEAGGAAVGAAQRIALIPDLLALWLTGEFANEVTAASTTALLDAREAVWALDLIARLGLPERPFEAGLVEPGVMLGRVLDGHAASIGRGAATPVWSVAGHDTASAFAAAPIAGPNAAILSSGTWSLLGLEVERPYLGPDALRFNLTNERGVDGTIRLLRNVMGLWLVQESRRQWQAAGAIYDYETLHRLARGASGEVALFDPDHPSLLHGGDVPGIVASLCTASGQPPPADPAEMIRCILTSLACKYRLVLEQLSLVTGCQVNVVHIVGGGTRNELLCQLTADLLGLPVLAGPEEATALGNVLVQARAVGELDSLEQMRDLVGRSAPIARYEPSAAHPGDETYDRFLAVTGLQSPARADV